MRFLLVSSVQHYQQIALKRPDLIRTHVPVTADIALAAYLEDSGTRFHELWSYISSAELERHWELAWDISRQWHGLATDELECFGAYPLRSSPVEMLVVCETALNANLAFQRLLEAERPTEVIGSGDVFPVFRYGPLPLTRGTAAIAEAIARWHCDRTSTAFSVCRARSRTKQLRNAPLYRQRVPMAGPDLQKQGARDAPLLVILDLGQNPDELFELERGLRQLDRFRILRVTELSRAGYPIQPALSPQLSALLDDCARRSARQRRKYDGPYPFFFRNLHLQWQFDALWQEVRRACRIAAWLAPVFRSLRPEAVLIGSDCFTCEGLLRDIAMNAGIQAGVLLHSGFGVSRGWRDLCSPADVTFAWGDVDRSFLEHHGVPSERLATVGSLRYFEPDPADPARLSSPAEKSIAVSLGLGSTRRIVALLTAQTNVGLAWSSSDPRQHRGALRQILQWARKRPDVGVILKPHPSYDHLEWYRYLKPSLPPNVCFAEGESLTDVLAVSDVAVLLNYCTTAALPAMSLMPVIFARIGYRSTSSQASSLDGDCVLQASTFDELVHHLENLLRDESFWNQRLVRQRAFLPHVFHDRGKHPAVHIADELSARIAAVNPSRPSANGLQDDQSAIMAELWSPNPESTAVRWGRSFARSTPVGRAEWLLVTALVLAAQTRPPAELCALANVFRRQIAREATPEEQQGFMFAVFLSAMTGALVRHRWLDVLALARETIRTLGTTALLSRYFWRVTSRAIASHGFTEPRSLLDLASASALGRRIDVDSTGRG
jgi:hypothetical protein